MNNFMNRIALTAVAALAIGAAQGQAARKAGTAVCYPWSYAKGTDTAQTTAQATVEHLARREGYASIPLDVAKSAWDKMGSAHPKAGAIPSAAALKAFGKRMGADIVMYGSVKWHTRSIWVNIGPKTISTATVNAYVFDVKSGKVIYKKTGVEGRSDEKSNAWKVAGAILVTPLVTAVSGGPMTPQQQRAVQIAMALAYQGWLKQPW